MPNMSFAMTPHQVRDQTKDVSRRLGWLKLVSGDCIQPVLKCMGLRPGHQVERISALVCTVSTRREPLRRMTDDLVYGAQECRREGFPELSPQAFVAMFCKAHKRCTPETVVTRIEFKYLTQTKP
jgi:hypothetical protein